MKPGAEAPRTAATGQHRRSLRRFVALHLGAVGTIRSDAGVASADFAARAFVATRNGRMPAVTGCRHHPTVEREPMTFESKLRRLALSGVAATMFVGLCGPVAAHDFRLGPLRIDHPYATPTPTGATTGAAYLRTLRNTGDQADRLIGATTPAARAGEIHRSVVDAQDVMRMRAIDGIDLPPKAELKLRHGGEHHLMLIDLKAPLKDGDRFPMTLRFEKAGEREVMVWVQTPRGASGAHQHPH